MRLPPSSSWSISAMVILALGLLLFRSVPARAAEQPRANVLLLFPEGRLLPALVELDRGIREELEAGSSRRLEFYSEFVESSRFVRPEYEGELLTFLNRKYSERKPDLIVAMWGNAMSFVAKNRATFFPETPVVVCGVTAPQWFFGGPIANATAVLTKFDIRATLQLALQLQPDTKHVLTIIGVSPLEKAAMPAAEENTREFRDRVQFEHVAGESPIELAKRVSQLPPNTVVLFQTMLRDRAGNSYVPADIIEEIAKVSKAPIYGMYETALGRGIVGGCIYSPREHGHRTGEIGVRLLAGEKADTIPTGVAESQMIAVDARQLKKWKLDPARLPKGTDIRFEEMGFWETYRWRIITAVSLITLEAGLIGALLVERRVRRRAERATQDLSFRLLNSHEDERRRVARELHDDITQRLARLSMDAAQLEHCEGDLRTVARCVKDGLATLSEDAHALAYRLHPAVLEELGLPDALNAECERFSRTSSIAVNIHQRGALQNLSPEVSLCLFRIAQEGLRNVARHSKARHVDVTLAELDHGVQLALRDDGEGFAANSKSTHPSLGIPGMKERAALLGGELDIESAPGHGTAIIAWLPLAKRPL